MKLDEQVHIKSWKEPDTRVDGSVVFLTHNGQGRIIQRDERHGDSFQWQLNTPPIDSGHGATSCTLLAEGDAATLALAYGALTGAAAAWIVEDPKRRFDIWGWS